MQLNDTEKRWLEINFYLLCNKIYTNTYQYEDIISFFKAFNWTNLFDYDIIIKTLNDTNLLFDPSARPSRYEFLLHLYQPNCRFHYTKEALKQLAKPAKYPYYANQIYKTQMREEVKTEKTKLLPRFKIKGFHEAYYSFLLTLRYIGQLYGKHIKL